jgi:hypothetical protein
VHRAGASSLPTGPPLEFDRHDAQDVHPLGLVLENLPQLRLGYLTFVENERLTFDP